MVIESYDFGSITIGGRRYTSDVIVLPDRVIDGWWRREGHAVCLEDLEEALKAEPEVLVIGTGYYGLVRVPDDVKRALRERGVEVVVEPTRRACEVFNKLLSERRRVVAALHLTC